MKTKKKSTTKKATKITREFLFGKRPRALRVRRGDAFDTSAPMWRRFVVMVVSSGRRRSVRVSRLLAEYVRLGETVTRRLQKHLAETMERNERRGRERRAQRRADHRGG